MSSTAMLHHSIFFNWMWILTNQPFDYIIFMHSPCLQNLRRLSVCLEFVYFAETEFFLLKLL